MIPIVCIGIVFGIIWNGYLIGNYVWVRLVRKWKAGIKEVKKSDEYKQSYLYILKNGNMTKKEQSKKNRNKMAKKTRKELQKKGLFRKKS